MLKCHAMPDGIRSFDLTLLVVLFLTLAVFDQSSAAGGARTSACVEAVGLGEIIDGRKQETLISGERLARQQPLETQGYISGITLYCVEEDVSAAIVNEPLTTMQRLKVIKNKLPLENSPDQVTGSQYRLAIAPKIMGDSISAKDDVTIAIKTAHGEALDLKIRQRGYRRVFETSLEGRRSQPLVFRFLGGSTDPFQRPAGRERLAALTQGIRTVEQAFQQELVSKVNIIDLKGHNNALSLKGKNEFWIYTDTFWSQDLDELRSMASHETLHILVDKARFAENPAIRHAYADLMGFGTQSKERAALLMRGHLPRGYASPTRPLSLFWSFIDERNFIEGMTGGHSSDNVDEYCTSFLHSLLYNDRLEANLRKPVSFSTGAPPREMDPQERAQVLRQYRNSVELFHEAGSASLEDRSSLIDMCAATLRIVDRITSGNSLLSASAGR